jgi:23S rRNA (cytosine1962-C5)-methyltransferase
MPGDKPARPAPAAPTALTPQVPAASSASSASATSPSSLPALPPGLAGVFPPVPVEGYALLDCGRGEKLERFGEWVLRRPDPQAMWTPELDAAAWEAADLRFVRESDRGGRWEPGARGRSGVPAQWALRHRGATLVVRPTPFKHVGVFPEQAGNWEFVGGRIAALRARGVERPALLNLFAYTGAATVLASLAGAFVTHVDSSRPALRWARENADASGLPADAVRWIEDDAVGFVRRELRRERRYHGIVLDPPPYGRGPGGETWTFEDRIAELLADSAALLHDGPAFLVISCYAVGTTPLAFLNLLQELGPGERAAGELALPQAASGRLLPAGLCGRWWRAP